MLIIEGDNSYKRWRCCALFLMLSLIVLSAVFVVFIVHYDIIITLRTDKETTRIEKTVSHFETEPTVPPVFGDLNSLETNSIIDYLKSTKAFNIKDNRRARLNDSFLFFAELHLPPKSAVLKCLERGFPPPHREARVVLLRGDKTPPVVEEYVLSPLPTIKEHRLLKSKHHQSSAPYLYRPMSKVEYGEVLKLLRKIDRVLKPLLEESYKASFFDCGQRCLVLKYYTVVSPKCSGTKSRLIWFWAQYDVELYLLNPVDFALLYKLDGADHAKYKVEKIWYAGQDFTSVRQLLSLYKTDSLRRKSSLHFPVGENEHSSSRLRGKPLPTEVLRGPLQIMPDGPRFKIRNGHVSYMDWDFDLRMSTQSGPQLFDVRHGGDRIMYEMSLQEIATYHSGYHPWVRYSNVIHSSRLLGLHARNLVPGIDCPAYSVFLPSRHIHQSWHRTTNNKSFCVFEHSAGFPLRRHSTLFDDESDHRFYSGLETIHLVVRCIISMFNNDFIVDFIFHANGVFEVKTGIAGYPLVTPASPQEARYGYRLHDRFFAGIEQTMFNFKVDVDVFNVSNRLSSIDIIEHSIHNGDWSADRISKHNQLKISEDSKMTEQHASFIPDSHRPEYFFFHNNKKRTSHGSFLGRQVLVPEAHGQILSANFGNEASVSWARYGLAVTKRKEDERSSSSIYAIWDSAEQMVNFQKFMEDNESIIDEDLVAWVTLRSYTIPSTESLPLRQTVGRSRSFFVLPFNFYSRDPSTSSRDAVRMNIDAHGKMTVENYGVTKGFVCLKEQSSITESYHNLTAV